MPIVVTCPGCPTKLSAPDSAAGKQIRCPKCGAVAPVPNLIPAEAVEEEVVEAKVAPAKPKPKPVEAEAVEEELPRKKASRRDEDDEDEPPRKKKKRRYDDDDDDYDHDHRRPRRKSGGGSGGAMVAVIVIGGVLLLAGVGAAVYFLTGKGGPLAKKTPPPPGWKRYDKEGFKAYFPNDPAHFSVNGLQLGNVGGGFGRNDLNELEGVTMYSTINLDGQANATVAIYRFRNRVPSSMRDNLRDLNPEQFGRGERRSVRWLGYSGDEVTTKAGVMRIVCADRLIVMAGVNGPNGTRAKPEVEDGFFDNFELTK